MAEIRLLPLSELLSEDQIEAIYGQVVELGGKQPEPADEDYDLDDSLGDDQLTDFMDRLEAHDIACDIYLPCEFDGRFDVAERTFGSASALADALDEIREELDIDSEKVEEDDEGFDLEVIEEQLVFAWRLFSRATAAAIEHHMPIHVIQ